ncbi:hypothetical protein [Methylocapsa sp. S129]|uniref:hypothetical protein n=1 Tax=Methylocapsa sp. S129 TaxID=1641869 RepID=UPI00131A91A1|nr:hypothetical protein [Methylocapsa sp. S129]
MKEDDRDFARDPASLLPFACKLMPANPRAARLPDSEKYLGEKASDGEKAETGSASRD